MTRYPKAGKGGKWTIKELDAIPVSWKGDTLNDGDGLSGDVRAKADSEVSVVFRYCFKWERKVSWFYCGAYPANDLSAIRANRDWARSQVKAGIDPRVKKITDKILDREEQEAILRREAKRVSESLTVQDMFEEWVADGVKRVDGNKSITQSFNKYILPAIGSIEIRRLTEHHLIGIYKAIIKADKCPTADELSKYVGQMLKWAAVRKPWRALLIEGNPAELVDMDKLLPPGFTRVRSRVLSIDEIKRLSTIFEGKTQAYREATHKYRTERPLKKEVQLAMWLCLCTLCRIGELLMTEWQHVDFESCLWIIPAENTKGTADKKTDHIVYLSDFALAKFKELKKLTGDSKWAFPARYSDGHVCIKSASKQIGDRQVMFKQRTKKLIARVENNSLVLGDEEWTPHDLRRTGATMMQGLVGANKGLLITDLCLHHTVVTGSAKHYLFDEYESDKREAWAMLGNRLEAILNFSNVASINDKVA